MRSPVLQSFIRDWLTIRGLEPQLLEADVWQFPVPKELRERFGRDEMTFSFNRRAIAKNPKSELATVGNPVFDRLLSVAREEGRIGIAYSKPISPAPKPPASEKIGNLDGVRVGHPEHVYQGIYHFVFTIAYPSIETADEMEVVSVDGGTLEIWAQTPDLSELWTKLERTPRKGRSDLPPLPIPPRVLEGALRAFERRMRRRIKKVELASQERLDEETASIKTYYEQLIEEARNQSRRWSTRLEDREDRIRWLQLEWKRRTVEATEFWRPNVTARLVALGIQMQPRVAYRLSRPTGTKTKGGQRHRTAVRVWDEATRTMLPAYCEVCGKTGLDDPQLHPAGGFLCLECAARPKPVIKVSDGFATLTKAGADR